MFMFALEIINTLRILEMHMGLNEYFFFNNRFEHHVAYMLKTTDQKRKRHPQKVFCIQITSVCILYH